MNRIIFKYNNEEEFYKLQDILLELGYEWIFSGKKKIKLSNFYTYLSLENGILSLLDPYKNEHYVNSYKGKISKDNIESFIEAKKLNIL